MRNRHLWLFVVAGLVTASSSLAGQSPVAVSPGSATGAVIESHCPTFSWGIVERASSYELVVYRVYEESEDPKPVLRESFPGSVHGWTPSLDRCLERGGRYAWSVRAVGGKEASEWSAPSLFEVAAGPGEAEFEAALQVVREYAERSEGVGPGASEEADSDLRSITLTPAASSFGASRPEGASAPTPQSHVGTGSAIIVDGAVAETKADPPCYPSQGDSDENDRFINCLNGTVLDAVTGLLWLEWANCRSCIFAICDVNAGLRTWYQANAFAANVRDGTCNLSDHSQAGDWRVPTFEEWGTIARPSCEFDPEIHGRTGDCYSDPENAWALELVLDKRYWGSGSSSTFLAEAVAMHMGTGTLALEGKAQGHFVWLVRSGQ